jgi:hypothetical protein
MKSKTQNQRLQISARPRHNLGLSEKETLLLQVDEVFSSLLGNPLLEMGFLTLQQETHWLSL